MAEIRFGEGIDAGASLVAEAIGAMTAPDLAEGARGGRGREIDAPREEQGCGDDGGAQRKRDEHDGDAARARHRRRDELDFDLGNARRGFERLGVRGLVHERRSRALGLRLYADEGRVPARKHRRYGVRALFVPHQGIGFLVAQRGTSAPGCDLTRERRVVHLLEARDPTNANTRSR